MKLKLIKPRVRKNINILDTYYYDIIKDETKYVVPPLSLAIIASLTPSDVEVSIVDENIEEIDFNEKVDLVGITVTSITAPRGYEIADMFRSKNVPVVIGGIHVRLMHKQSLEHADSVIIGEAENLWWRVINDFKHNRLKRVYKNKKRPGLTDNPLPKWDLVKNTKYSVATIMATRGCPHNCEFCVVRQHFGNNIRKRPVEDVVKEVAYLRKYYHRFWFVDYNMFFDKAYAKQLLNGIVPLGISYICFANMYIYKDNELLDLMVKSGCKRVSIGFETTDPKGLKLLNKTGLNRIKEYAQAVKKIQGYGIQVKPQFIIGFDYDNTRVFDEIETFVNENNILFPDIYLAGTFYGTSHFRRLKKEGRIDMNAYSSNKMGYVMLDVGSLGRENAVFKTKALYSRLYSYDAIFDRMKKFYDAYKETIEQPSRRCSVKDVVKRHLFRVWTTVLYLKKIRNFEILVFALKLLWHPKSIYKNNPSSISYDLSDIERRRTFQHPYFFENYLIDKAHEEHSKNPLQNNFDNTTKINLKEDVERFIEKERRHYEFLYGNTETNGEKSRRLRCLK